MAALKPYSAPPTAYGRYNPFLILTARLLGERPSYYPVLSLAPSALATHVGLFSRLFGAPAVDMRAPGALSPRLRRLTYMAASRANECAYCTANGCAFGDVFRGPIIAQVERANRRAAQRPANVFTRNRRNGDASIAKPAGNLGDGSGEHNGGHRDRRGTDRHAHHRTTLRIDPDDANASEAESAILRLAALAVTRPFPATLLPRLVAAIQAVRVAVGAPAAEMVQSVVALAGAVNTLTGALGVAPEPIARRYASTLLPSVGSIPWEAFDDQGAGGEVAGNGSTGASGGSRGGNDDCGAAADGGGWLNPPRLQSRTRAQLDNVMSLLRTVPAATAGLDVEAELYAGIPAAIAPLYAWVDARLGTTAGRFLLRPMGIEVARAFCFALRENVLIDDVPSDPRSTAGVGADSATRGGGARRRRGGGGGGDGGLRSPDASQWTVADRLRLVATYAAATRSAGLAEGARAAAARCGSWPSAASAAKDLAVFSTAPDTAADSSHTAADASPTAALAAARRMVRACATGVEGLRGTAVADATAALSGRGMVEVASVVSTAELWRRLELLFGRGWTPLTPGKRATAASAATVTAASATAVPT
ncbi:hypothetical protein MMPV_004630 [Pyropia vietnamensis]